MSELLCCYGKCPACGSFLDVLQDNKDGTYIPKTLTEHQQDRLMKPSMPTRNGKPVSLCSVCYKEKQHNHGTKGRAVYGESSEQRERL